MKANLILGKMINHIKHDESGLRAREGDFIETADKLFFDVKGFTHPPDRIIAFIRYIPAEGSDGKYRKIYDLSEREKYLRHFYPKYLYFDEIHGMELQAVPTVDVHRLYDPRLKVEQLRESSDPLKRAAYRMIRRIEEATGLDSSSFGVSGSILIDQHRGGSDIDLIVYGTSEATIVKEQLTNLLEEGRDFKRYERNGLHRLYLQRRMPRSLDFKTFQETEGKKVLQGIYKGYDYYVRCVKDWGEVDEKYGDRIYTPLGFIKVKAKVTDSSESFLTPCTYKIGAVEADGQGERIPEEVVSFRGRFCEQAVKGDLIVARGKLEQVASKGLKSHRIVIGGSEHDYMYPVLRGSSDGEGVQR